MKCLFSFFLCAHLSAGIPTDKAQHAVAGAAIYLGTYSLAVALDAKHPRLWALGATLAAGLAKEALDRRDPLRHTSDPLDAAATLAGGLSISFAVRF